MKEGDQYAAPMNKLRETIAELRRLKALNEDATREDIDRI